MREMKDSGVAWIGEIPETWETMPVKNVFEITRGRVIAKTEIEEEARENYYPVYSSQTANNGVLGYIQTFDYSADSLTWTTDGAKAGTVFLRRGKYSITNVCGILTPKTSEQCLEFLHYTVSYSAFNCRRADINGYKIMSNEMAIIPIVLPPISTQQKIAAHLDRKCTQIDALISNAQQQIEKLKAYKQSVITETVTKGLDPDVAMKDSGYDFIGMIPASWEICKLRHIGTLQNGISKGGEFFGTGFPFVSYGDIYKNFTLPEAVDGLVNTTETERKQYSVERGDIFFTRTSETIEEVGFSCVCEKTIPDATFAGFVIRVRPFNDKLLTGFAKYYFRSSHHRFYLVKEMNLVTRASLSQGLLKSMPVLVPKKEEQQEISDYLDHKCSQIDKLIALKQQKIEKLQQYKKSLIYEYVTGKKEV